MEEDILALHEHKTWKLCLPQRTTKLLSTAAGSTGWSLKRMRQRTNTRPDWWQIVFNKSWVSTSMNLLPLLRVYHLFAYCSPMHTHAMHLWLNAMWIMPSLTNTSTKQLLWDNLRALLIDNVLSTFASSTIHSMESSRPTVAFKKCTVKHNDDAH